MSSSAMPCFLSAEAICSATLEASSSADLALGDIVVTPKDISAVSGTA